MKYEESLSEIVLNTECLPGQYCVCYVSLLTFLGMVMYANEVETKKK